MATLSEHFDLDVEKQSGKLVKGGSVEIADALGYYQKTFIPAIKADEGLISLQGYWCEGFLKSLLNEHLSPAQREEILQILSTDFSSQMIVGELRSYYWGVLSDIQQKILELLHDQTIPKNLQLIFKSVQELVEEKNL